MTRPTTYHYLPKHPHLSVVWLLKNLFLAPIWQLFLVAVFAAEQREGRIIQTENHRSRLFQNNYEITSRDHNSYQFYACEFALANLQHQGFTSREQQALVAHLLAIQAHATLANHAQRV